jgi:hypothetical protein
VEQDAEADCPGLGRHVEHDRVWSPVRRALDRPARAGYFATATTPTLAAFELTLIAALSEKDAPRTFDYEVRLRPHGSGNGDREVEFLAEVPLRAIEITTDAARGTYTAHLSFVAFIEDETGRPVARLSQDWPIEGKLNEAGRAPRVNAMFRRVMSLPAGRYTVESAIQDRMTGRISVVRTPVEVAPTSSGIAVASAITPDLQLHRTQAAQVARAEGPLADILRHAADYVVGYERVFSDLVAEETYIRRRSTVKATGPSPTASLSAHQKPSRVARGPRCRTPTRSTSGR